MYFKSKTCQTHDFLIANFTKRPIPSCKSNVNCGKKKLQTTQRQWCAVNGKMQSASNTVACLLHQIINWQIKPVHLLMLPTCSVSISLLYMKTEGGMHADETALHGRAKKAITFTVRKCATCNLSAASATHFKVAQIIYAQCIIVHPLISYTFPP